jgi:anti-sigma regulatory factor (Ser/Thr protein kinase)
LQNYLKNQEEATEEHIRTVVADQGPDFEPVLRQRYEGTRMNTLRMTRSWY